MLITLIVLILTTYLIGSLSADFLFSYIKKFPGIDITYAKLVTTYPRITSMSVFISILFEFASGWLCAALAIHFFTQPLFILCVCFAAVCGQLLPVFPSKYDNSFPLFAGTLAILYGWFFVLLMAVMWIFIRKESKMTLFTHLAVTALVPLIALVTEQSLISIGYGFTVTVLIIITRQKQIRDLLAGKNNELVVKT